MTSQEDHLKIQKNQEGLKSNSLNRVPCLCSNLHRSARNNEEFFLQVINFFLR